MKKWCSFLKKTAKDFSVHFISLDLSSSSSFLSVSVLSLSTTFSIWIGGGGATPRLLSSSVESSTSLSRKYSISCELIGFFGTFTTGVSFHATIQPLTNFGVVLFIGAADKFSAGARRGGAVMPGLEPDACLCRKCTWLRNCAMLILFSHRKKKLISKKNRI